MLGRAFGERGKQVRMLKAQAGILQDLQLAFSRDLWEEDRD